jgi:hypothetical protein
MLRWLQRKTTIAAVALGALAFLYGQENPGLIVSSDGQTVYDKANDITWPTNANLAATNRFGLPLCTASSAQPCINATGSMTYAAAAAWVSAMNAARYLGHSDWRLPTTPPIDHGCTKTGPNGSSFGYGCTASAMGSLYYNTLSLKAPNTAVPIPTNVTGPSNDFIDFQPYLYWSQTSQGSNGYSTFSFATGWTGANTVTHVMYLLPMIPGKLPGTPAATGQGLLMNPGGQTVYDPVSNVTWAANANLAASTNFGLPPCLNATTPAICVNADGAMNWGSANQFIVNMNSYNGTGYLGQKNWQLPTIDLTCNGFTSGATCTNTTNPMGELFYNQFALSKGMSAVQVPNTSVGPFHNIQPYLYWSCLAATIQEPCESTQPVTNQEWSFSFGNGFEGTDLLANDLYVTAYFVGYGGPIRIPRPLHLRH